MKVVVIGGGIAGLAACTGIRSYADDELEVILVEPKDHIEVFWASYRSLFHAEMAQSSIFSLEKYAFKHSVKHIQSTAQELTDHQVKLANGVTIEFDVCVLAMGASMPYHGLGRGFEAASNTRADRLKALATSGLQVILVKTVLIVGGGLVGSELAGDIAVYSKNASNSTRVILVHSGDHLCPEMNDKAGQAVKTKLEELGVKVILNEKAVKNSAGKMVLESSGKVIEADQVVMTVGIDPMNSFVDPGYLNQEGWVEVDEYFQVKGAGGKLFAFGDCCTLLPNTGYGALQNINVIGYNIKQTLNSKKVGSSQLPSLSKYYNPLEAYICTVGPDDGVIFTPYCSCDCLIPRFKNYSMFLFEVRYKLGLEAEIA